MTGGQVEATPPARRASDGLPVVRARARGPVLAADRREAELAFDRQPNERLAGETILGQRERACLGVELLDHTDVERGERNIALANILKIADALQIPASEIHARAEQIQATKVRH